MASLKDKTISGIFWSFLKNVGASGIQFIAIIILARILTPKDFGLIAMLSIFIQLSQQLVTAGFGQALIQKKDTDDEDYTAVFYINLVVSLVLYGILFFVAPLIADFYHQPRLISLTRVLSLVFVVNAFSYVQDNRLKKEMAFKTLAIIHIPAILIAGITSVVMALYNCGVWSLVALQLVYRFVYAIQLWFYARWKPLLSFNRQKAKGLFSFGSKLMISSILNTLFSNAYVVVIGKFFPLATLGYYQNAKKLVNTPTQTISTVLSSVTFSAFSSIQDDNKKLKIGYKKVILQQLFWMCPAFTFVAVLAKPLFSFVLTDKWLPAVPFFQLLCVVGILFPLNSYNLNIVNVKGRSDLYLKLNIINKVISIIGIVITLPFGIWPLVIFQAANAIIRYFINSYFSGRFIQYPMKEQLEDVWPIFLLSVVTGGIVFFINIGLIEAPDIVRLITGGVVGTGIYLLIARKLQFEPYLVFGEVLRPEMKRFLKKIN